MQISVAPVDADPLDPAPWSAVGYLADAQFATTVDDTPEYDHAKVLDTLKELSSSFKVSKPAPDVVASILGIPVLETPALPDGVHMFLSTERMALYVPRCEPRPYTALEREGEWARRAVRHGLADVLEWLGEDPGPDPDAAYTDDLWKVTMLPRLAVNPA
jgi:hypothetical protein